MQPDDPLLMRLAGSALEGGSVDWDEAERAAPDDDARQLIRCLRDLHLIGEAHRDGQMVDEAGSPPRPARDENELLQSAPTVLAATRTVYRTSGDLEQIGPYRILEEVGAGGMGVVYAAEQEKPVRRRVALKLVKTGMDSREAVARFEAERQALALMNHPHIARVFDGGTTDQGHPFFVMEFVQGLPITEHCDKRQLTTVERLELFSRVCEAVQHAHQKGIIHRDIKPSNILVSDQDGKPVPKIIDFGVAKATSQRLTDKTMYTHAGMFLGTPEYSSPEQAELSGDVDTRADVYSLGMVLYELLVGELPFDRAQFRKAGSSELLRIIREQEAVRPSTRLMALEKASEALAARRRTDPATLCKQLQGDLDWIVLKALEKSRARRYQSAAELAADIARHERHEPVLASPPGIRYRARKFARRHRLAVSLTAVFLTILVGFAVTMTVQARHIARERDRANREAETAKQVSNFLVGLFKVSDPGEARGNMITARELLDEGARRIKHELADQPLVQARLMHDMANVYIGLGLYEQARSLAEQAVEIRRRELGEWDPDHARSLLVLGGTYAWNADRSNDGLALCQRALEILEKEYGPDHPEVAWALYGVRSGYLVMGERDAARNTLERALSIFEKDPEANNLGVSWCLNDLGLMRYEEGDLRGARVLFQRALEIKEQHLPPDHPDLATALNNVGYLHMEVGDYDAARPMLERSLSIAEKVYDANHPLLADRHHSLGELWRRMGDASNARLHLECAIAIREKHGGSITQRGSLAYYHHSLALTLRDAGEYAEAESHFQRAVALREDSAVVWGFSPDTKQLVETLKEYAQLLRSTNREAQAHELEARAEAIEQTHAKPASSPSSSASER